MSSDQTEDRARLARVEQQVAAMEEELAALRAELRRGREAPAARDMPPAAGPTLDARLADALRRGVPGGGRAPHLRVSGLELESLVGRYGTLAFGALLLMMAVGAVIKIAVMRGWLTPEVRIAFGAAVALAVAGAGLHFRHRGERRYGNVLLGLSLAIVDLLAWGAGPHFHLVPVALALGIVDVVALAMTTLALHDESEFLFSISVGAALSAPFVTADAPGSVLRLLAYGAVVLLGALRALRHPGWLQAFIVLVVGALAYALAAASMPLGPEWRAPFLIVSFAGVCSLGALLLCEAMRRGDLARAFLAVGLIGVPVGWDRMVAYPGYLAVLVGGALAMVTYASLWVSGRGAELWTGSALALPLLSLGVASAGAAGNDGHGAVFAAWGGVALAAWRAERRRGETWRGGVHFLAGGILVAIALATLLWSSPLGVALSLAGWGVVLALLCRDEEVTLPLVAVGAAMGGAVLSAMDQLLSRPDYSYLPFLTRSSASALGVTVGIGVAGWILGRGRGRPAEVAGRGVRLGAVVGFAVLWGRMEVAGAFSADLSGFLLVSYYAACGVGSIVAGRRLGVTGLRVAGLVLAIFAAVKAVVEATNIDGVGLRVGAYGAVGVFMLGAGYLYRRRESGGGADESGERLGGRVMEEGEGR